MKIFSGEKLGRKEAPYLIRWGIQTKWFSVRLHHWLSSDDLRAFHDHAWDFLSIALVRGYTDISPDGEDVVRPGHFRFRRATHQHSVKVGPKGCWTLLLTGPEKRQWGFWYKGRFRKRNKWFFKMGHH